MIVARSHLFARQVLEESINQAPFAELGSFSQSYVEVCASSITQNQQSRPNMAFFFCGTFVAVTITCDVILSERPRLRNVKEAVCTHPMVWRSAIVASSARFARGAISAI